MTTFDERENIFEAKYANDAALQFKVEARANKLLGLWAAKLLGKEGDAANAFAMEVVKSDFEEAGKEDVYRKVSTSLGYLADEATIRAQMAASLKAAKEQVMHEH
ncbi:MAG: DUF1476 domain-containing protein [Alphaproteobacteria bacterium]|nr:DUF1476 domain-containing protein [Alphaproteobacteria bacterium]